MSAKRFISFYIPFSIVFVSFDTLYVCSAPIKFITSVMLTPRGRTDQDFLRLDNKEMKMKLFFPLRCPSRARNKHLDSSRFTPAVCLTSYVFPTRRSSTRLLNDFMLNSNPPHPSVFFFQNSLRDFPVKARLGNENRRKKTRTISLMVNMREL